MSVCCNLRLWYGGAAQTLEMSLASANDDSASRLGPGNHRPISIELAMGVAIEARRIERRVTLCALSRATNIPKPLLIEYEAGVRRAGSAHVLAIADALDTSVGQLFRLHPGFSG